MYEMGELISDMADAAADGMAVVVSWMNAPVSLSMLAAAVALWWLGMVESEHLTRHSAKPSVGHH